MSEPDHITAHATVETHADDGVSALATQLRGKPRVEALLRALLDQVQAVEDDVWELYALGIAESSDAALDQLGAVLGHARPAGASDATYRRVLRGVVIALRASGAGPDLLAVMRELIGGYAFTLTEAFPGAVVLEPSAAGDIAAAVLLAVLRRAVGAGIRLQVVDVPSGDLFAFSTDAEVAGSSSTTGFSDTSMVTGGELVGIVST